MQLRQCDAPFTWYFLDDKDPDTPRAHLSVKFYPILLVEARVRLLTYLGRALRYGPSSRPPLQIAIPDQLYLSINFLQTTQQVYTPTKILPTLHSSKDGASSISP